MKNIGLLLVLLSIVTCGNQETKTNEITEIVKIEETKTEETSEALESADIFEAAKNGDLKSMQKFIADGVDVNIETKNGDMMGTTPLMVASWEGHIEIVKLLIENGADVNASRPYGDITALNEASQNGHTEIVKLLIKHGAIDSSLIDAAGSGDIEKVRTLIEEGTDVNIRAYGNNVTALNEASENGHLEIVQYLVEKGADVNLKSGLSDSSLSGEPSLMYALEGGHTDIVEYLESL